MKPPKAFSGPQRRVWRITTDAPQGKVVDPDRPSSMPSSSKEFEELLDTGWQGSSYDLLNGLEVTESPAESFDGLFEKTIAPPSVPKAGFSASRYQWILRFALKYAELDARAEPKRVLVLARQLSPGWNDVAPEDAARASYAETEGCSRESN